MLHNALDSSSVWLRDPDLLKKQDIVLCDFGLANTIKHCKRHKEKVGIPGFMAPEVTNRGTRSKQSDVYGLGIILFQMLFGMTPFKVNPGKSVSGRPLASPERKIRCSLSFLLFCYVLIGVVLLPFFFLLVLL